MLLFVKGVKERGGDGIGMSINAFHEGILVKVFNEGLDIIKKVVFSVRSMIVDGDHKADMADVTRHLERAGRVARLAFSQAA